MVSRHERTLILAAAAFAALAACGGSSGKGGQSLGPDRPADTGGAGGGDPGNPDPGDDATETPCWPPQPRKAGSTCATFAANGRVCMTLLVGETVICSVACDREAADGCPSGFGCVRIDEARPDDTFCRRYCNEPDDCDPGYATCDTDRPGGAICS